MSKWWHLKLSGLSIALFHMNHFKAPSTLRGWDIKEWAFSLVGSLLCMHVHSIPLYTRPCHLRARLFLPGLKCLNGLLMVPMWNDYDKLSVNIISYLRECWDLKLSFCGPRANELPSILWLVINASLFAFIPIYLSLWTRSLSTCLGYWEREDWWNSH